MRAEEQEHTRPGVVLFDDPMLVTDGWACYAGDEPRQVTGTLQLPSTGVWVTNLSPREFLTTNLATNRFRSDGFLRSSLGSLANELGIGNPRRGAVGRDCAKHLACLLGDVLDVATRLGVSRFPPHALQIGFRVTHYHPARAQLPEEVVKLLSQSLETSISSQRRRTKRSQYQQERMLSLVRHRYMHAIDILDKPVPYGSWRSVPRMSSREIAVHEKPLLLKVEITNTDDVLGQVLNFGGRSKTHTWTEAGRQVDASPRRWITHPEYCYLHQHADITVMAVLEAEAYQDNPLYRVLPEYGFHQQISPAFLLALESLWSCPYKTALDRWDPSPVTHWMQAYDRILCLREAVALALRDPDIDITGIGNGRVRISITEPQDKLGERMWDIVQGTALIPPACPTAPAWIDFDATKPVEVLQALQLAGDVDRLLQRDAVAIQRWDEALSVPDAA